MPRYCSEDEQVLSAKLCQLDEADPAYAAALNDLAILKLNKGETEEARPLLALLHNLRAAHLNELIEDVKLSARPAGTSSSTTSSTGTDTHSSAASAANASSSPGPPPSRPRCTGNRGMGGGVAMFARALGGRTPASAPRMGSRATETAARSTPQSTQGQRLASDPRELVATVATTRPASREACPSEGRLAEAAALEAASAPTLSSSDTGPKEPRCDARADAQSSPDPWTLEGAEAAAGPSDAGLLSLQHECCNEFAQQTNRETQDRLCRGYAERDKGSDAAAEEALRALLGDCSHVVEVYGVTTETLTSHLEEFVALFGSQEGRPLPVIKWVDDHHALLVCPDGATARCLLQEDQGVFRLRPYAEASAGAKTVAAAELLPPRERPKTTTAVAKRLLSHALGMSQLRDRTAEKDLAAQRKAAREARREREQKVAAAWDDD